MNVSIRVALSVQMLLNIRFFKIILSHPSYADMVECFFAAKPYESNILYHYHTVHVYVRQRTQTVA